MDGVARCSRYAFGPNRLHLCGPDANKEVLAYIDAGMADPGLQDILRGFHTLYPYLQSIAQFHDIRDPFDERVVEAYWIGNSLLDNIPARSYYRHLTDQVEMKRRFPVRAVRTIEEKLRQGAPMHHNFHVLNLYKRTGHREIPHTIESLDKCRISWGKVTDIDGPVIIVKTKPLVTKKNRLSLGGVIKKRLMRRLDDDDILSEVKIGEHVAIHWDVPCEVLSTAQVMNLKRFTNTSIALANNAYDETYGNLAFRES